MKNFFLLLGVMLVFLLSSCTGSLDGSKTVFHFFGDNWAVIALVISEIAAFLPSKFNGITQVLLKILSAIFTSKEKGVTYPDNKKK